MPLAFCDFCGASYSRNPNNKKRKNHYCSKVCKDKHHPILYGSGETKDAYQKRYYIEHRDEKIAKAKARYAANPQSKKEYDAARRKECAKRLSQERREKYQRLRSWDQTVKAMHRAARSRAKKQRIPFSLVEGDIIIPDVCPVLGITLVWNTGKAEDNSPSLDKVIPALGYVRGNIAVISHRANRIKHNASYEEIQKVADWLKHTFQSGRGQELSSK